MLETALNQANEIAKYIPWEMIVASGILSPLILGVKKWLSIQSERVMITLVTLFSGAAVVGNYLLHVPTTDPRFLAVQTAVLAFMTQPVYFFIVKPAIYSFRSYVEKAAQFNAEVKSAAVPAGGLTAPVTPEPTTIAPSAEPAQPDVVDFKS